MLDQLMQLPVEFKILDDRLGQTIALPEYASPGAAAVDLRAAVRQDTLLAPGEVQLIPTGLAIHLQSPHWCAVILPRSGLGHKHGVVLGNLVGLIDADYQGELMISCWNRTQELYLIREGDRIAQMMFLPVGRAQWQQVEAFSSSERGQNGFGSTGLR